MGKLMSRRDYNWDAADRTALGRSASLVVLQSLGINGGGILTADFILNPENLKHCKPTTQQYDSSCYPRHRGRKGYGTCLATAGHSRRRGG